MDISQARAIYGLTAVGTPIGTNSAGSITIGVPQTQDRLDSVNAGYSLQAVIVGASSALVLDLDDATSSASTAFTAGAAQVETATVTAASGITTSGNATVTVTAAGMTGSPKAISVALTTTAHTTATLIATAIAADLNADADYSAMFTATSSTNTVITTRKPTASITVSRGTLNLYDANDATLNVAIANDTTVGITTAATSANTTAGVLTVGTKVYDADGLDAEGEDVPTIASIYAIMTQIAESGSSLTMIYNLLSGGAGNGTSVREGTIFQIFPESAAASGTLTMTCGGSYADVTITILGATA